MKRLTAVILTLVLLLTVCCSCKGNEAAAVAAYKLPERLSAAKSCVLAENENHRLDWDYSLKRLILTELKSGKAWSSYPDGIGDGEEALESNLSASIKISYIEPVKTVEMETDSQSLLANGGFIAAKKIKNGIRLTYYFNDVEISVPVEYVLDENGLTASVLPSGITEGKNKLYSVSLLPFFASAENNTDSYVFVPSGSGALMYTDDKERTTRSYSEPVFGQDETVQDTFKNKQTQSIKLPVFGIKSEDSAMLGILEEGAESAYIEAKTGDSVDGYSYVYAKFLLRGSANAYVKDVNGGNSEVKKITDGFVALERMTVRYSILSDKAPDYNLMAAAYREYLGLKSSTAAVPELMLGIWGGAEVRRLFLGIPYHTVEGVTDFNSAKEILADIKAEADVGIVADLKGFGKSGIDYGKIGGGFKFGGFAGKQKDFESLNSWCEQENIVLAVDYDLMYFNKSSSGYSASFDTAKTANDIKAQKQYYSIVTHEKRTDIKATSLLKRGLTDSLSNSLLKATESYGIRSVGLASLSSSAYSDYKNPSYYNKAGSAEDFAELMGKIKQSGKSFVAENANSYSAVFADYILNSPTSSSLYNALDVEIPFYQMVFHGAIPLSSGAINLADDGKTEFLKAMSTGSSLYFTVCDSVDSDFIVGVHDALAVGEYSGIKDMLIDYAEQSKELIARVGNSNIVSYEIKDSLSRTEFENGTVVFVNFGNADKKCELGTVKAQDFIYG